jgi:hypothetical protein
MSRKLRRQIKKRENAKKYSLMDIHRALRIASNMKKATNGHLYKKVLTKDKKKIKLKCVFCGTGTSNKKTCDDWVLTYLDRFQAILINPDFYREDDTEAVMLLNSEEYKRIKLPVIPRGKDEKA